MLALDQGTTSSRAIVFDQDGKIVSLAQEEFSQIYPQLGWVEHNPADIWNSQLSVAKKSLAAAGLKPTDITAIGVANQRETTIVWDTKTGQPVCNAIVWQCRRTAPICDQLRNCGWTEEIRERTGLIIDAYFSGPKIKWILDNIPGTREKAEKELLRFGNVDTYLLWKLTSGKVHTTDYSNASRTMMFNINTLDWDDEILQELGVPRTMLPEVLPSSCIYGYTDPRVFGAEIPIAGDAGDQQAALFGQACFQEGMAKNTYGTGCFMLLNTGKKPVRSKRLLTTIAWGINGKVYYALEGSIFITGGAVQWLRDGLQIIRESKEIGKLATQVSDSGGVYFVPAFVGLGAPYWDMYARGTIVGVTRGTTRAHIARAVEEAICYQTRDIMEAMEKDADIKLNVLRVDGGAVKDNLLMQIQADTLGVRVQRPIINETTALGAAYLAGIATDVWGGLDEIASHWAIDKAFEPKMPAEKREKLYKWWKKAVKRALNWAREE